jgi:hypothetical protein
MKRNERKKARKTDRSRNFVGRNKRLVVALGASLALCSAGLAFAPKSIDRLMPPPFRRGVPLVTGSYSQLAVPVRALDHGRLLVQPVADKLRRRLGQRFDLSGREISTMTGTLTVGSSQHAVTYVRTQDESGERVDIALDNGPVNLTWDGTAGAISAGNPATGSDRSLIERLALDSPDQFIMAQLRLASYYTVAQSARPASVGGDETYNGPVWDIVRVAEPTRGNPHLPLSSFRLYHLNVGTGLLDKIVSVEQGQTIEAQISTWANQGGEIVPTRITWMQGSRVVMDLNLTSIAFGPIQ